MSKKPCILGGNCPKKLAKKNILYHMSESGGAPDRSTCETKCVFCDDGKATKSSSKKPLPITQKRKRKAGMLQDPFISWKPNKRNHEIIEEMRLSLPIFKSKKGVGRVIDLSSPVPSTSMQAKLQEGNSSPARSDSPISDPLLGNLETDETLLVNNELDAIQQTRNEADVTSSREQENRVGTSVRPLEDMSLISDAELQRLVFASFDIDNHFGAVAKEKVPISKPKHVMEHNYSSSMFQKIHENNLDNLAYETENLNMVITLNDDLEPESSTRPGEDDEVVILDHVDGIPTRQTSASPVDESPLRLSKDPWSSVDHDWHGVTLPKDQDSSVNTPPLVAESTVWECPICLDKSCGQALCSTQCGHMFCMDCIQEHLKTKKKCPICRANLFKKKLVKLQISGLIF